MSSIYYKQTLTGLYTNFCPNLPDTYKKDAFAGLLFYIYSIFSNWSIINYEFTKLCKIVAVNYYYTYLLDNCIISFFLKLTIHAIKQMLKRNRALFYLFRFTVFLCLNIAMMYVELQSNMFLMLMFFLCLLYYAVYIDFLCKRCYSC